MTPEERGINVKGKNVEYHRFQAKCVELLRAERDSILMALKDAEGTISANLSQASTLPEIRAAIAKAERKGVMLPGETKECDHGELLVIHKCADCGETIEFT